MSRTRSKLWSVGQAIQMNTQSGVLKPTVQRNYAICTDSTHRGPPYKAGGALLIRKKQSSLAGSGHFSCSNSSHTQFYSGSFWVDPAEALNPVIPSEINLSGWGTKGYNRGLPVHDELNFGQFGFELKDMRQMVNSTYRFFSQFSSHAFSGKSAKFWSEAYLNSQFGWKPFLNDFYGMLTMRDRLAARLRWLKAHNGKDIHRHFTLSSSSSRRVLNKYESRTALQPVLNTQYYFLAKDKQGYRETVEESSERIWFDGLFTFHIPNLPSVVTDDFRLTMKLTGLFPDLNLIYKVTPWTWLLDWFTSVGAAINTGSIMSKYHQVARHAYVMREAKTSYRTYGFQYVATGDLSKPVPTLVSASATKEYVVKQRSVANPYGFGVTWDGLNPFQLSILAALGITRSHSGT